MPLAARYDCYQARQFAEVVATLVQRSTRPDSLSRQCPGGLTKWATFGSRCSAPAQTLVPAWNGWRYNDECSFAIITTDGVSILLRNSHQVS